MMHLSRSVSINNEDTNDIEGIKDRNMLQFNRSRRVIEFLVLELIEILPDITKQICNLNQNRTDFEY